MNEQTKAKLLAVTEDIIDTCWSLISIGVWIMVGTLLLASAATLLTDVEALAWLNRGTQPPLLGLLLVVSPLVAALIVRKILRGR